MSQNHLKLDYNESGQRLRKLAQNNSVRSLGLSECFSERGDRQRLLQLIVALQRENTALRGQLRIDPMTGLFNRFALFEEVERQWERWLRHGRIASLLVIDVNDFKSINDSYGHAAGDRALISVARHLRQQIRGSEWVARIGGDEFAVLLPDSDAHEAQQVAAKLCTAELIFPVAEETSVSPLTLRYAIGVSTLNPNLGCVQQWVDIADHQMYLHKRSGYSRLYTLNSKKR